MGYLNRLDQLVFTLETIALSEMPMDQLEVVIVDDGSEGKDRLTKEHVKGYPFEIVLVSVPKEGKTWKNPVVAYNLGIFHARGEWVILQNPEVCHVGDICSFVTTKCNSSVYHVFRVFAVGHVVPTSDYRDVIRKETKDAFRPILEKTFKWKGVWYVEPHRRRRYYHFCSAIHRSILDKVGGFNAKMRFGVYFDDDEFLLRVRRVAPTRCVMDPYMAIHQWHPPFRWTLFRKEKQMNKNILLKTRKAYSLVYCDPEEFVPEDYAVISSKE